MIAANHLSVNTSAIAIGGGNTGGSAKTGGIAIGQSTALFGQASSAIAIGNYSVQQNQGAGAISIGDSIDKVRQGINSIAIGSAIGMGSQGDYSIILGSLTNGAQNNTTIINATGNELSGITANSFYAAPIRAPPSLPTNILYYDSTNSEIVYGALPSTQAILITPSGNNTFSGTNTFTSGLTVSSGTATFANGLAANTFASSGAATLSSTLAVSGKATFASGLATNTFASSGAATLSSTLAVSSNATFASGLATNTFASSGAATLSSTLAVSGNATFSSGLATNTFASSGAATLSSTLAVSSNATFSSGLATNTFACSGAATLSSTLAVSGDSYFGTSGMIAANQLSVNTSAIAIGYLAGKINQATNSVVINASGTAINGTTASSFYAAPIRNPTTLPTNILYYDSANSEIVYGEAPTTSMTITNNNTTATPWYPTFVSASGTTTSTFYTNTGALTYTPSTGQLNSTSFNATSDYRIKENVTNLDDSFSVDNLRPVTYFNKNAGKQDIGFIAHEIQEIFPYLVTGEKDGEQMQSLNYLGLIGVLTKEIKELKKRVSALENKPTV